MHERQNAYSAKKSVDFAGIGAFPKRNLVFRLASITYLSQIERGLKSPSLAVILRLTQALRCSAGRLVGNIEKGLNA